VTFLGRRVYRDQVDVRQDLRGRSYYWIGGPEENATEVVPVELTPPQPSHPHPEKNCHAVPPLNESFAGQSSQCATGKGVLNRPPRQLRRSRIKLLAFHSKLKSTLDSS